MDVLPKLTSLQRLVVRCNSTRRSTARKELPVPDMVLPLSLLMMCCSHCSSIFLQRWSMPKLAKLEVFDTNYADFSSTPAAVFDNVKLLTIAMAQQCKFSMGFFESKVCYPALTHLNIVAYFGTAGTLSSFRKEANCISLLECFPRLEHIMVSLHGASYSQYGNFEVWITLVEVFISASATHVSRLCDVKLALPVNFPESLKPALVNWKAKEVDVRVYQGTKTKRSRVLF